MTLNLPESEMKALARLAVKQNKSKTAIVREALASYVETAKEKP